MNLKRKNIVTFYRGFPEMLIACVLAGMPVSAHAQSTSSTSSPTVGNQAAGAAERYWTPERLKNAKPMELYPKAGPDGLPEGARTGPQTQTAPRPSVRGAGSPPLVELQFGAPKQLLPAQEAKLQPDQQLGPQPKDQVVPEASSSFGARFTTGRVFPDAATTTYPNSTAGKLFFHDPRTGGNFVCSASVLRPRLIVTAGHCVTHPSTDPAQRYFFTNLLFIPAFRSGTAPFLSWTSSQQWVADAWFFSDGSVPNAQDVAILIARDQVIARALRRIGSVTGFLGFFTNQLSNNNATMLGYPCNLDSCQKMEINNAQTFTFGGSNTFIYGSAMRGGSSGGPWMQDYGVNPVSNPVVSLGNNFLIAVTSYGPIATEPKYQGASNLDARFINVLTNACNSNPGNC